MRQCNNWLKEYLKYTDKAEPPELFHLWTGIGVLSTAIGRKVKFIRGHYTLYPNVYIILVAGSARCRKSTALRMGNEFLIPLNRAGKVNVVKNKVTPEKLVKVLGDQANVLLPDTAQEEVSKGSEALLYAPELTTLITPDSDKNGLLTILTDLYDCPDRWENDTKNKGHDFLYNVFLNTLGATTPKELGKVLPVAAIGSGFTSRVTFIFQRTTDRCFPRPELYYRLPEKIEQAERLATDLQHISRLSGEFTWSPAAAAFFDEWYGKMPEAEDEKMEGYLGRKHDHAIKLAMLLTLSVEDKFIIEKQPLIAAISLLDEVEKFMSGVYSMLASPSTMRDDIRWILRQLIKNGGKMNHSDLMRKGWDRFDAEKFTKTIITMCNSNLLGPITTGRYNKKFYSLHNFDDAYSLVYGALPPNSKSEKGEATEELAQEEDEEDYQEE